MLESKAVICVKLESTYGTDPTPGATDAILASDLKAEPAGKTLGRKAALPYFGGLDGINVGEAIKIAFSIELRGAGVTPNTPPRIGRLLRACNMTETIDSTPALENTKYDPNSAENGESIAIYFYKDGILHKAMGCVGTWKLEAAVNEISKISFDFTGLYASGHASSVAFPTPTFGDAAKPPIFRSASFTVHAYAALISKLSVDIGNKIAKRSDANSATGIYRYWISDREARGGCDPEVVALATFNPWSLWDATTVGALSATIGNAAGNRLIISMPNIVPDSMPKYGNREGIVAYDYNFKSNPTVSAGNNEVSLKFN